MKLSIIIISNNRINDLRRCLKSVFNQNFLDFEVIVLNNGSKVPGYSDLQNNFKDNFIYLENNHNVGASIARNQAIQKSNSDTNLIINISEDGWFGDSIGPDQHFAKSIFRALENDTFFLRSANKGISAFINNNGKTIKRLEPDETGNIELNVPLINNNLKNKNDLIFFILLFTYTIIFLIFRNKL